jgi:hypothetical protein
LRVLQTGAEAFYTNKRTGTLDNYCKECRKANTRKRRDLRRCTSFENKPVSYPVITEVKDPALRMLLILHARQVVAESISRKQEKERYGKNKTGTGLFPHEHQLYARSDGAPNYET